MWMHRNAGLAAMLVAGMALAVKPRSADEMTEEERKTPPPPPKPEPAPMNLPGETNRQFAARMQAARDAASQPGTERGGVDQTILPQTEKGS